MVMNGYINQIKNMRLTIVFILLSFCSFGQVAKNLTDLESQNNVIRNEAVAGANTRGRIADMYKSTYLSSPNIFSSYSNPSWITSLDWSKITGSPSFVTLPISDATAQFKNQTSNFTSLFNFSTYTANRTINWANLSGKPLLSANAGSPFLTNVFDDFTIFNTVAGVSFDGSNNFSQEFNFGHTSGSVSSEILANSTMFFSSDDSSVGSGRRPFIDFNGKSLKWGINNSGTPESWFETTSMGSSPGDGIIVFTDNKSIKSGIRTAGFYATLNPSNETLTEVNYIINAAKSFSARQTFNGSGTIAGFNFGARASDPTSLNNGDAWYNSTTNTIRARINGSNFNLLTSFTETDPLALKISNNLSDLSNTTTARTNLGLGSAATQNISAFAPATSGTSILKGNGSGGFSNATVGDYPTLNQNTTGTAANITATVNATLTTLSSLSLPVSQLTGILPVSNGGTGVNTSTGTGSTVRSIAPTFSGLYSEPFITVNANGGADGSLVQDLNGFIQNRGSNAGPSSFSIVAANGISGSVNGSSVFIDTGTKFTGGLDGNIALITSNTAMNFQGMQKGIFINNATTAPTAAPAGGFFHYSNSGVPTWRTSTNNTIFLERQSAVTSAQGLANAITALGLLDASTISVGGGLTYSQAKAISMKIK